MACLIMINVIYTSRLHEKHPWYSEQLTFLMVNTDNNAYLTKDEFFEAAKVSPDMQVLNFSYKQLENLVDGLIAIGDQVIIWLYLNRSMAQIKDYHNQNELINNIFIIGRGSSNFIRRICQYVERCVCGQFCT